MSAHRQAVTVDAAVCGEPEALRALPRDRVEAASKTAAPAARHTAVEELVARGVRRPGVARLRCSTRRRAGAGEVVAALLAAGATVDLAANDGQTPLLVAAAERAPRDRDGADRHRRDAVDLAHNDGRTPLLVAAAGGHHEVVAALIAARATVDQANNDGPRRCSSRRRTGTTRS